MESIQYVGNSNIKIKVDEVHRLCDGTWFIGQNEKLGRCFGIMNEKGDMWYAKQLQDNDIELLSDLAEGLKDEGYWEILCIICKDYKLND